MGEDKLGRRNKRKEKVLEKLEQLKNSPEENEKKKKKLLRKQENLEKRITKGEEKAEKQK